MSRFIVVNPDLARIQGDIACETAATAVGRMEGLMSLPTDNDAWHVYRAPAGFPSAEAPYRGDDAALLALLAAGGRPVSVGNARRPVPAALSA